MASEQPHLVFIVIAFLMLRFGHFIFMHRLIEIDHHTKFRPLSNEGIAAFIKTNLVRSAYGGQLHSSVYGKMTD